MADYRGHLEILLNDAYRQSVLGKPTLNPQRLADALAADVELRKEAERYLSTLTEPVIRRDFISKTRKALLESALGGTNGS